MKRIIVNKIQCKNCKDIIESKTRHNMVWCKCGKVAVDGGHDYLRRVYKDNIKKPEELYKELSK